MGIDAQRSGTSELRDRAVEVRRGRIAYPDRVVVPALRGTQGATTKAIRVWIVPSAGARLREAEQRLYRPHSGPCNLLRTDDGRAQQDPCALRVAAEPGPR